jgi:capsular polysaccharide transport system permease protein
MNDTREPSALPGPSTALERAQAVSRALADAARRVRFSTRARSAYRGGTRVRRGSKLIRIAAIALLILVVVIPNCVALVYFGLIASDQYIAKAEFTVTGGIIPKMDGLGSVTGVPPALIVQDTQIVTSYIGSRPMVEQLEESVGLREIYSSPKIDWWGRFRKGKPIEKFVDYWERMCTTSITLPSGIVTLTVRAFNPQDAKRIAEAVVSASENLINDMNDQVRQDTVQASEHDMAAAAQALGQARLQMQYERNAEGLIDVGQTSKAISDLISDVNGQLLTTQQDYQTQLLRSVSEDAPQMHILKSRISAMQAQLGDLNAQLTTQKEQSAVADADKALSGKMTKFAELDLAERLAEKRYATSVAAVEAARMLSERKMLYLRELVSPALPQESQYPQRLLSIAITFLASILSWVTLMGAIVFVRNHMA